MRRFLIVILFVLITSVTWSQSGQKFTLDDCITYALANNIDVQGRGIDREIAEADIGVILSDGLPQVNADVNLAHNYLIPQTFVPAQTFAPGQDIPADSVVPVAFQTSFNGSANIVLDQQLFDGSYFLGLRAAKVFKELADKDYEASQIEVVEAVTKAYYTVLVNEERIKITERNYTRLDTLLRETQALYENGFAEKIDVSRVKIQFNNIKVERERIGKTLGISYLLLKFQMGMAVNEPMQLAESIRDIDFNYDLSDIENFDYTDRVEVEQLNTNRDFQYLGLRNNRVQYLPTLDAFVSIGATMGANSLSRTFDFSGPDRSWIENGTVGIRLNVPIFDGLRKSNEIQKSKLRLKQIDAQMIQLQNSISIELQQARTDLDNSLSNLETQEENMELAKEVYEVTKIKFQEGVGSNSEVTDADEFYKQAQNNYYTALYDALIAKVDLQKAMGTLYNEN